MFSTWHFGVSWGSLRKPKLDLKTAARPISFSCLLLISRWYFAESSKILGLRAVESKALRLKSSPTRSFGDLMEQN